jgi:BirA family biotin operon repressor/biotin-[acetyl-CoA-carboxylase] ligase
MDFKVIHIDETDSTNRWLRDYALSQPEGDYVVVSEYQTAGRGCGTNSWESERGKNLTFSLLIHPTEITADCQFRISEAVSLALCETLDGYVTDRQVSVKWPNDIYVDDCKICGMLIENRLRGRLMTDSIIGIGLNVNQREFFSDAPNPVSLVQLLGHEVALEPLLQAFLQKLEPMLQMDPETLGKAYRERLYRREGEHEYRDGKGLFRAKLLNVLDDGRLVLLDTEGTARIYAFKEVQFVI